MIPLFKPRLVDGNQMASMLSGIEQMFREGIVTEGKHTEKFERRFSDWVGNPLCSVVNSCTSALTLAYVACGVAPGAEVITTPMTCMATNLPIKTLGGHIYWADINPNTGNIDPVSVKKLITSRTKAIVAVDWSGCPCDLDELRAIGKAYGIPIIEDAAHSLGATYKGQNIGLISDFTCFSFQAIKHLTTIDGGAVMCKTLDVDKKLKKMRWFGLDRKFQGSKWEQDITEVGFKFHMNNLNGLIGCEQMANLDETIKSHIANGKFYDANINNPKVKKLVIDADRQSSYWIYTVLVDDQKRFQNHLMNNGIASDIVHYRNDRYSIFKEFRYDPGLLGVDEFCSKMINIPVGWWIRQPQREYICNVVNSYV